MRQAIHLSRKPCVINRAEAPYEIVALNSRWTSLCGFRPEEALGKSPKDLLNCKQTDQVKAAEFTNQLLALGDARVTLLNKTRSGRQFWHKLRSRRLTDPNSGKEYYVTTSEEERDPVLCRAFQYRSQLSAPWDTQALMVAMLWAAAFAVILGWCMQEVRSTTDPLPVSTELVPQDSLGRWAASIILPFSAFDQGMILVG